VPDANPPANGLAYPFDQGPAAGAVVEVASDVFWIRMPLPFALDHINLWALSDGDGWTLIDTGIDHRDVRALWRRLLAGALAGRPIRHLICTHFHPDHFGLAGWFDRDHGVALSMTRGEWTLGSLMHAGGGAAFNQAMARFFQGHGLTEEWAAPIAARDNVYARLVAAPPSSFRRLRDGDEIAVGGRSWRVVVGTGHAPEHACLHCAADDILISGDQVLPRITTNVSVWPSEPEADPLGDFLATVDRLRALPETTLVLPSHGLPFRGLPARLEALRRHHEDRLAEIVAECDDWRTAFDVLPVLFSRPLDDQQIIFAMGEAIAHLAHLRERGVVERRAGDDGVVRFRRADR